MNTVTCPKCGGYVPGHATGAGDICTCEPITTGNNSSDYVRRLTVFLAATKARLDVARAALAQVVSWHSDPESPDYNGCDKEPCAWCEEALTALDAPAADTGIAFNPRDWREDFSHENGKYMSQCSQCQREFIGHKRRTICKLCAADTGGKEAT